MTMPSSTIRRVMIRDTGSYYIDGVPISGETIAHSDGTSGSFLELYCTNFSGVISLLSNDTAPTLKKKGLPSDTNYDTQRWQPGDVDQCGLAIPIFKVTCVFNQNSLDDMKRYGHLVQMSKTKGYKELISNPIPTDSKAVSGTLVGSPLDATPIPALSFYEYGDTTQPIGSVNVRIMNLDFNHDVTSGEQLKVELELREIH